MVSPSWRVRGESEKGPYRQGALTGPVFNNTLYKDVPLNLCETEVLINLTKSEAVVQPASPGIDYIPGPCTENASKKPGRSALTIHRGVANQVGQPGAYDRAG